ncbi:MAG: hypothetical protein Q4C41_01995 [Eggerthellaceae bacterium]|nr:hypothetical protein [Eggerthellaceae bacterium]
MNSNDVTTALEDAKPASEPDYSDELTRLMPLVRKRARDEDDLHRIVGTLAARIAADGSPQALTEALRRERLSLLAFCELFFLFDWMPDSDANLNSLQRLCNMAEPHDRKDPYLSRLDCLFYQIEHGSIVLPDENGRGSHQPTNLRRKDGMNPVVTNGLDEQHDFSLKLYRTFMRLSVEQQRQAISGLGRRLAYLRQNPDVYKEILDDFRRKIE